MLQTDHFIRFEKVGEVFTTDRGLVAEVETEQLRIDLVSEDVVRVKMSRGGVFDESPTFAVCVDPLAGPVEFSVRREADRVLVTTSAMVVSLWLDPFRLDVHRPDGTPVVETAADPEGRYWAYATLNDTFTVRRTCRQEDGVFGLGEKAGRHNRKGRDFTMWNTDVLSPTETLEFTAGKEPGDPRGDRHSVEFDPFYVTIPFFYHQTYPGGSMAGSFLDNGYRGEYEFSAPDEYRMTFHGGQYTEYIFAGPDMPVILTGYTALTGRSSCRRCGRSATTSAAGSATPRTLSRRSVGATVRTRSLATHSGSTSTTWTSTASSRGTPRSSRTRRECSSGCPTRGSR